MAVCRALLLGLLSVLACSKKAPVEPPSGPPEPIEPPVAPAPQDVVLMALGTAYATRDLEPLADILARSEIAGGYLFFLGQSLENGTTSWDRDAELRIHRRLFDAEQGVLHPDSIPVGLTGVRVACGFVRTSEWIEPIDPYLDPPVPPLLDPLRWRATEAMIRIDGVIDTQEATGLRFGGRALLVAIEDLSKPPGTAGKFLLYRCEEFDGAWGGLKATWR